MCDTTVESLQAKLTEAYTQKAERQRIAASSPDQIRADFAPSVLVAKYRNMYAIFNPQLSKKTAT